LQYFEPDTLEGDQSEHRNVFAVEAAVECSCGVVAALRFAEFLQGFPLQLPLAPHRVLAPRLDVSGQDGKAAVDGHATAVKLDALDFERIDELVAEDAKILAPADALAQDEPEQRQQVPGRTSGEVPGRHQRRKPADHSFDPGTRIDHVQQVVDAFVHVPQHGFLFRRQLDVGRLFGEGSNERCSGRLDP